MHIIICNEVSVIESAQYRHFNTPVPFHLIPVALAERMEIKMVNPQWYKAQIDGWGDNLRTDLTGVQEVTGLDKFYWRDGVNCFTLSFKPIVGLKTVMGEGIIESYDPEIAISNSPVIDFDYQDSAFESGLEKIQLLIRSINY